MVDYGNGKVYKIVCNNTGKVYIGSTTQPLSKRLVAHRLNYKKYLNGKYSFVTSFEIIKENNYEIILIENVPCNNKEELRRKERYYIENNKCVNKVIPLRTDQEYQQDKKEILNQKSKIYKQKNKDKIKEYQQNNRDRLIKYHKEYYKKNAQKFKEYVQTNIYTCPCGATIQMATKTRHLKTKKHIAYVQSLNVTN